ncbi:MAG: hypothetical protein J6J87_11000 [Oscillospiraceae bacterium]|nr:hypothetical protein [Oscillospiraceae bacterium]
MEIQKENAFAFSHYKNIPHSFMKETGNGKGPPYTQCSKRALDWVKKNRLILHTPTEGCIAPKAGNAVGKRPTFW